MEKLCQRIVIILLIYAPLAFGTVTPLTLLITEGGAFLGLLLYLIHATKNHKKLYQVPGLVPLLCFLGYILFQLLPLPAFLVRILSPEIYQIYADTVGVFQPIDWIPLTLNREDTLSEFFRYGAYVAIYVLLTQLFTKQTYLKKVVSIVAIFGACVAIVSILQHYTADGKTYWLWDLHIGNSFGPYGNHNHYAGLMEMIAPLIIALFLFSAPTLISDTFKEKVLEFFDHPRIHRYLLLGTGAFIILVSVFVSLSRGGMISLMLSLVVFGIILDTNRVKKRGAKVISIICLVTLVSVGWFGWDLIFDRFDLIRDQQGDIAEARVQVWQDSQHIIADFPVTGTGFGTYRYCYPIYRTFPGRKAFTHAHNDYIELVTDGGILGTLFVGWFLVPVFFRSFRRLKKRREPYMIFVGCGAVTGILAILIHSLTDFNFHIGANGLYFSFLAALFVATSNTRIRYRSGSTKLGKIKKPFSPLWVLFILFLALTCLFHGSGNLISRKTVFSAMPHLYSDEAPPEKMNKILIDLKKNTFWNPFWALSPLMIADALTKNEPAHKDAVHYYQKAVVHSPADQLFHHQLANYYSEIGKLDKAEALYRASVQYASMSERAHKVYGTWLLDQERTDEGLEVLKKAISLAPHRTETYLTLLAEKGLSDEQIAACLPDRVLPYISYGKYLESGGKSEAAEAAFQKALLYLPNEEEAKPGYFFPIYKYYMAQEAPEKALEVMRTAIQYLPDNVSVRLAAARLYEEQGVWYRAEEEYQKALMIDPYNRTVKHRLKKLQSKTGNREL